MRRQLRRLAHGIATVLVVVAAVTIGVIAMIWLQSLVFG